ncbi:UbiH/UbiF/VisC/COQ6 family ubiquinone biosynthesis hydroxylase [Acidisphaera sp. L21]|uniref:UbiH/UbiF/VisC/COQ6 family ubiquinone biosynthesis hydroxylase n=1 Tax=Acidisphaera sp. L21 TaxID=1641851 RepID=UPI00131C46CD|nr:UbiH/UbiF/VisC/COQ6 family ubiquinone biosynthesis hydroxylase [Acidisphaera sp. L21]
MADRLEVDVCVVGAGPVGGALACSLAAGGVRVAVVDRSALPPMEHPAFDGRAYAIAAGSRHLLEEAGIWARLPFEPCPILDIRVSDGKVGQKASPLFLHFDHADADAGPFGWMVEARSLRVALNAQLHALESSLVFAPAEASVTRSAEGAVVQITGGPAIHCRLVVAAEGRGSPLRNQAGIRVSRLAYRQHGIVSAVAHERPHRGAALEHFLPGGPFAQLPMTGTQDAPNLSAIVWTERAALAPRMMALDDAAFGREIARRMGDHLGAMRPVGRRWIYKLSAMHAHSYTAERLALVGDAAHGIHPIAGQGLNLGLRDVITLAGMLRDARAAGEDLGSPELLARYQARRRPANLLMLGATHALDRLFSTDNPLIRTVRDAGIAGVHRLPSLKRMFMRQAMGA